MKTTMQNSPQKTWKTTATLLILGLAFVTSTFDVNGANKTNPLDAASIYPVGMVFSASKLVDTSPGYSPGLRNLSGITWDYSTVMIDLSSFWPGYYLGRIDRVDIRYAKNKAGQIISIKVEGIESIPGARDARFHDTPWIPLLQPVTIDPISGYTIQVRVDNIPVYRHTTSNPNSPVEQIVGYMALGDLVLTPRL